jgi:hypothetical protein
MTATEIRNTLANSSVFAQIVIKDQPQLTLRQVDTYKAALFNELPIQRFNEVTVRIETEQKTRRGAPKPQRRRFDMIALVYPMFTQRTPLVIGVEIKVSRSDLMNDSKILDYLPYCHYLYIAVPTNLQGNAQLVARQLNDKVGKPVVGVIDCVDTASGKGSAQLLAQADKNTPKPHAITEVMTECVWHKAFKTIDNHKTKGGAK